MQANINIGKKSHLGPFLLESPSSWSSRGVLRLHYIQFGGWSFSLRLFQLHQRCPLPFISPQTVTGPLDWPEVCRSASVVFPISPVFFFSLFLFQHGAPHLGFTLPMLLWDVFQPSLSFWEWRTISVKETLLAPTVTPYSESSTWHWGQKPITTTISCSTILSVSLQRLCSSSSLWFCWQKISRAFPVGLPNNLVSSHQKLLWGPLQ